MSDTKHVVSKTNTTTQGHVTMCVITCSCGGVMRATSEKERGSRKAAVQEAKRQFARHVKERTKRD